MRHTRSDLLRRTWTATLLAGLIFGAAGLSHAEATGTCISTEVPQPIVLPDGSEHPAGSLTLCLTGVHTPVAGLHETRIDGKCVGLFLSRKDVGERDRPAEKPYVLFHADADGRLVLIGYAAPDGDTMRSYRMAH